MAENGGSSRRSGAVNIGTSDYMGTSPHAGYDDGRNKRAINNKMEKGLLDDKDEADIDLR
jgi:hypothetical protein